MKTVNSTRTPANHHLLHLLAIGTSALALITAQEARAQVTPDDPECEVTGDEVVCEGNLADGVRIEPADDFATLIVRNVDGNIDAATDEGVAIDFVNNDAPVSISIDDDNLTVTSEPTRVSIPGSSSTQDIAIGVRAQSNRDISVGSNATIEISGGELLTFQAGIAAFGEGGRTGTPNVEIVNDGSIDILTSRTSNFLRNAGIYVGYARPGFRPDELINFGDIDIVNNGRIGLTGGAGIFTDQTSADTITIENNGSIEIDPVSLVSIGIFSNGVAADTEISIANTGDIQFDVSDDPLGLGLGIRVDRIEVDGRSGSTHIENSGTISARIEGTVDNPFSAIGIEIRADADSEILSAPTTSDATDSVINSGTIFASDVGIRIGSASNRSVTNSGLIEIAGERAGFGDGGSAGTGVVIGNVIDDDVTNPDIIDFYNPLTQTTTFTNEATGEIRANNRFNEDQPLAGPAGAVVLSGNQTISNAGSILAEGTNAIGIASSASIFRRFGGLRYIVPGEVDIENSGSINAIGDNGRAIEVQRFIRREDDIFDSVITNSGTLSGDGVGADGIRIVTEAADGADAALANSGATSITLSSSSDISGGTGDGAGIRLIGGAINTVDNAGMITADSGIAIIGGIGSEQITNSGTIDGTVSLAGGDDAFTLVTDGVVTAAIDGGDGDDVFSLTGANGTADSFDFGMIPVTGFERFVKDGTGTWDIVGDASDLGGVFSVEGGVLRVNGAFGSTAFTVSPGALLGGTGTLGGLSIEGGTLAAGNSIGTLTVNGDLSFDADSIFQVEVNDQGGTDLLIVNGSVTLGGATLDVVEAGEFAGDDPFNFIIIDNDATDAVNGTFGTIENDFAFLTPTVSYDAGDGNDVQLSLAPNNTGGGGDTGGGDTGGGDTGGGDTGGGDDPGGDDLTSGTGLFPMAATTINQTNSAIRLDELNRTDADADDVYMALLFATTPEALTAFDSASGEIYSTLLAGTAERGIERGQRLLARAVQPGGEGLALWGGALGRTGSVDGDGNAADIEQDRLGLELGIDYRGPDNGWAAGASVAWLSGDLDIADRTSDAEFEGWSFGGYARYGTGHRGLTVSAAIDYTASEADVTRDITVATLNRTALGTADYDSVSLSGEVRYGLGSDDSGWAFGPVVSVFYADAEFDGVDEIGAGALNLSGTEQDFDLTRYGGGLFAGWRGETFSFDLSAQYLFGSDEFAQVGLALDGSAGITRPVRSPLVDGDAARITASATTALGGGWSLSGEARALLGSDQQNVAGSISLGWQF